MVLFTATTVLRSDVAPCDNVTPGAPEAAFSLSLRPGVVTGMGFDGLVA